MKENLLGTIIGFASALYTASAFLDKVISRNSFSTDLDGVGFILEYSVIKAPSFFSGVIESQIVIIHRI